MGFKKLRAAGSFVAAVLVLIASLPACRDVDRAPQDKHPSTLVTIDIADDIKRVGSPNLFKSEPAKERLASIGPAILPVIEARWPKEPSRVRVGLIEVLENLKAKQAESLLLRAAEDPEAEVQREAITALASRPSNEVNRRVVLRALSSDDALTRLAAANACGRICESAEELKALVEKALDDAHWPTALAARGRVGELISGEDKNKSENTRRAVEELALPRLHSKSHIDKRTRAALLAADIRRPEASDVLVKSLSAEQPPALRLRVIYALGTIGNPNAVEALAKVVDDSGAGQYVYDAIRRMAKRNVKGAERVIAQYSGTIPPDPLTPIR